MVLNGFVNYLSMAVFRPMCLTHNTVFDLEAVDRDWLQTRAMHVSFHPSNDNIEIHAPHPASSARDASLVSQSPPFKAIRLVLRCSVFVTDKHYPCQLIISITSISERNFCAGPRRCGPRS